MSMLLNKRLDEESVNESRYSGIVPIITLRVIQRLSAPLRPPLFDSLGTILQSRSELLPETGGDGTLCPLCCRK